MWDLWFLSYEMRDRTLTPCNGSAILTTGAPGKSHILFCLFPTLNSNWMVVVSCQVQTNLGVMESCGKSTSSHSQGEWLSPARVTFFLQATRARRAYVIFPCINQSRRSNVRAGLEGVMQTTADRTHALCQKSSPMNHAKCKANHQSSRSKNRRIFFI